MCPENRCKVKTNSLEYKEIACFFCCFQLFLSFLIDFLPHSDVGSKKKGKLWLAKIVHPRHWPAMAQVIHVVFVGVCFSLETDTVICLLKMETALY